MTKSPSSTAAAESLASRPLLSSEAEAQLFWRLRQQVVRVGVRQMLSQSRLRLVVFAFFTTVFWMVLFRIFAEGFHLVQMHLPDPGTRVQSVQVVFNMFFLALTFMMTFSSAILLYGNLYRSSETAFLLTTPTSCRRIVLYRFQETMFFTGWGFLLLGSPLLVAYGAVSVSPWYYFALLLPFMVAFVAIPTALGAIACLLVMWLWPHARGRVVAVVLAVVGLGVVYFAQLLFSDLNFTTITPNWFHHALNRLRFVEQRVLPSWWLSTGLLAAAHPASIEGRLESWCDSLLFLGVIVSNALFLRLILGELGEGVLRISFSQSMGKSSPRPSRVWQGVDYLLLRICGGLPLSWRLLVLNDFRLCRRDPLQWSQLAIFFGLFALYFVNLQGVPFDETAMHWTTLMGFLNLGVVCLILSAFTTRFVFPLISLEGRRFWVLSTLPITRDTILWAKLLFACVVCWLPCAVIVLVSDILLGIVQRTFWVAVIHQLACLMMCVSLASLAVGLGARFPEMRSTSPSQIAAGFGGTLNLVVSACVIISSLSLLGVPCFFCVEMGTGGSLAQVLARIPRVTAWIGLGSIRGVAVGIAGAMVISACATVIPLVIGFRAFRRLEMGGSE